MNDLRLGVDLGGTKIEVVALDSLMYEVSRRRIPTPAGDYHATLGAIANLVAETEARCGRAASIGIGTPGSARPDGTMKNANSVVLNGKPLRGDLEALLGRTIAMSNDASCFVLSEAFDGAAAGARVVFGVILGTGVGGGIAVESRVLDGANSIAGEWGHNPLPWPQDDERPGPSCYCGKNGCMETFLSGPAFAALRERDPERALERYANRLGRGLASVINVLDPDVIVLGGGVSNLEQLYALLPDTLAHFVFSGAARTRIVKARHGDSSGVRGAALLAGNNAS